VGGVPRTTMLVSPSSPSVGGLAALLKATLAAASSVFASFSASSVPVSERAVVLPWGPLDGLRNAVFGTAYID
jgi:hypothetical protein